jgi:hypothetical protein
VRKEIVLLIGSLVVGSCSSHYSGRLIEKDLPVGSVGSGIVPDRAGTVPYRNQDDGAKVAARRDDALRKVAKFCGSDGYTVSREGPSASASNMSEVEFRCGESPATSASGQIPAQPAAPQASAVAPQVPAQLPAGAVPPTGTKQSNPERDNDWERQ